MSKSGSDVVAEMIYALNVADPTIDASIGSAVRKILDVVGDQIAPAYADSYLSEYAFSVDSKSGADLDDFTIMFGIYRLPAKRAVGVVTFSRPSLATTNIEIPSGTQIATGSTPNIVFATVGRAVLIKGTVSISVPVQAVVAGQSGNLPANALSNLISAISGVSGTTQQGDSCVGGVDAESDDALRERYKATVFRSLAGTEDMFRALALEDSTPDDPLDTVAVGVNVIGAVKHWTEQVQVTLVGGNLVATSQIPTTAGKFFFAGSATFGEDIQGGDILTEGVHYTYDLTGPVPKIIGIGTSLDPNLVYDLDFEYVPTASRNDPANNITNRVDIWVSGVAPQQGSETTYFVTTPFNNVTTSVMYRNNYLRMSNTGEVAPTNGNAFLQLAWGPIIDFPNSLTIDGVTYLRDTDYWVVHDITAFGLSSTSRFGLEWISTHLPATGAQVLLSDDNAYFYNRLPADVEARCRDWKLVTDDTKAHAAKVIRLRLNIAIMYAPNYDRGIVQAAVDTLMANWMNSLGFRSTIQVSDLIQVLHAVSGVDNVRFLNSLEPTVNGDAQSYGIERVASDGTSLGHIQDAGTPARPKDMVFGENEVPALYGIRYETRAQNTYGERLV